MTLKSDKSEWAPIHKAGRFLIFCPVSSCLVSRNFTLVGKQGKRHYLHFGLAQLEFYWMRWVMSTCLIGYHYRIMHLKETYLSCPRLLGRGSSFLNGLINSIQTERGPLLHSMTFRCLSLCLMSCWFSLSVKFVLSSNDTMVTLKFRTREPKTMYFLSWAQELCSLKEFSLVQF